MRTLLLTGFEPFAGADRNPSADAVALVAESWSHRVRLVTATLPVEFISAGEILRSLTAQHSPDVVIATGVADGRAAITPERIAVNLRDARIPDNARQQPVDEPVRAEGPAAVFTRLPVKRMVSEMTAAGIRAEVSLSAGTYVCNSLMYELLADVGVPAGFIHVPPAEAMPVETTAQGLSIALRVALDDA